MEPGHEDREYNQLIEDFCIPRELPQWSPVMKTGNTPIAHGTVIATASPQWSPVMKTGNTNSCHRSTH